MQLHISHRLLIGLKLQSGFDDTNNTKYSIDDILNQAERFIEEYNYDMAQKFLERALEINSDHPRALEMTASLLIEVTCLEFVKMSIKRFYIFLISFSIQAGQIEQAKQCLGRAITVLPNEGYAKYFSLAQLFSGQESLDIYKQGILILQEVLPQMDQASG